MLDYVKFMKSFIAEINNLIYPIMTIFSRKSLPCLVFRKIYFDDIKYIPNLG